ncbi:MAG: glycosyltransferase family 2 protein, partial [Parafilimonas terrae]|nr:glycosyltransferase family 2 protein [Parafilimonas terrae]
MSSASRAVRRGDGSYLGEATPQGPSLAAVALAVLKEPRRAGAIATAWICGKRLRARQRLAALVGIDHRLALPAARMPRSVESGDQTVSVIGAEALVPGAADRIARVFAEHPDIQAVYGDGLIQEEPGGPVLPRLPPAFDPDLLMAVDYLGTLVVRRGALPEPVPAQPVEAAFLILEQYGASAIGHLPGILSGRSGRGPEDAEAVIAARLAAARGHLDRTGLSASTALPEADGVISVTHPLTETPLVSVIVPTRDRLDLLAPCLDSLRGRTVWPALEIIVCDNDSREAETHDYLRALAREGRGVVVRYPGPFNFAAMNNEAARRARGRLLVFMNNDVEAFRPDWLVAMARHALRKEVGAVGAKLLDGEGRIQHGGIILGTGGLATHGHRHFPGEAPGYLSTLRAAHRVSAVTAACLMVEADKFWSVGGFDADNFAVDFNDVDLCLRLNVAGYRTMLAPEAVLHHREAASRRRTKAADDRHATEVAAFKRQWGPLLVQDPHYNPGFDPALS